MKTRAWIWGLGLAAVAAVPAQAQSPWAAWHGCWQETVGSTAPVVCVLPGDDAESVRIGTVADGVLSDVRVLRADGVAHPVEDGGCSGTERAFFSADGRRVFTRAELRCGNGIGRTVTGVQALVAENEWLDAEALTVEGQHASRVTRLQAVGADALPPAIAALLPADRRLAQETARMAAALPLDFDAVTEASAAVAAPVVEALLAARRHGFGLNGAALLALRDAGVARSTIDVMVALSYPQRFVVTERGESQPVPQAVAAEDDDRRWDDPRCARYGSSRWSRSARCGSYDPFYFGSPYGYGYNSYNGYGGYNGWNSPWSNRPVVVIVEPEPSDVVEEARVVKGRGYVAPRRASSSDPARDPGTSTTTGSARGSSTSTGSSSTGSSSSDPPTRTAKPRPGGGG